MLSPDGDIAAARFAFSISSNFDEGTPCRE
jgi:hypothetical protein